MAYNALFGAGGPPRLGATAPAAAVNLALTAQQANAQDIAAWHMIEAAYLQRIVRHRYVNQHTNAVGCHLTHAFLPLQQAGKPYTRLALGARHQHINSHVAAYMVHNVQTQPAAGWQVSHLCHNGSCVNPAHLILETAAQNRDRNKCQGWTHIPCPGCNVLFSPCQHNPQCVLP